MGNQQGNRQGWHGRPGKVTGEPTGWQGNRQGVRGGDRVTGEAWQSGAKWTKVFY